MRPLSLFLLLAMLGLQVKAQDEPQTLDEQLAELIAQHNLTGDPAAGVDIPDVNSPMVKLGKKLFFTKALSGNKDAACASCHHPYLGGGDALALPIGVNAEDPDVLGPGRTPADGQYRVPRNSPTIFNSWSYVRSLFRDSRVEFLDFDDPSQGISTPDVPFEQADPNAGESLLAAQARFPVVEPAEMQGYEFEAGNSNDAVRAHLTARIADVGIGKGELFNNRWRAEFEQVFDSNEGEEIITFANITRALAAYQKSMNFSSNPWFDYIKGDKDAISDSQKRGAILYYTLPPRRDDGGEPPADWIPTQCVGCHSTDTFNPVLGTNEHRLAFPQIGPGTGHDNTGTNDFGRGGRSGNPDTNFEFRSPTLLNIEVTGPYGHAGNYQTLEEVMEHYNDFHAETDRYIDTQAWCQQPQFADVPDCAALFPDVRENTQKAIDIVEFEIQDGAPVLLPLNMDESQIADMVAFMKALTDPCVKDASCLQPWLPQPEEGDPDGLVLRAKAASGVPLYLAQDCTQDSLASNQGLKPDQQECVSGAAHYFYVDVPRDNTTLYFSAIGIRPDTNVYFNPWHWATEANALASNHTRGEDKVLVVTANKGRAYFSVIGPQAYENAAVVVGMAQANVYPKEQLPAIADACAASQEPVFGELRPDRAMCLQPGVNWFFVPPAPPGHVVEFISGHGEGEITLTSAGLSGRFAGQGHNSGQYLRLDNTTGPLLLEVNASAPGSSVMLRLTPDTFNKK